MYNLECRVLVLYIQVWGKYSVRELRDYVCTNYQMRHPAALASLCNQWRILQTSQPRSSAPSQLVTRSNLTHGKQAVVTNHTVLVPILYITTVFYDT